MFLKPTDHLEIEEIIGSLRNDSSPGKDKIAIKTLKSIKNVISKPLAYIINLIFETSLVPTQFKESIVIPIFKDGNKMEMTNYRPISLLNGLSKIFEKSINKRLTSFLNEHKIISNCQFGFQKGISTEQPLQILIENILSNFNSNKKTIGIFLDLQKAFDTVNHSRLLEKLNNIGIRGKICSLFKSYLTERYHRYT